MIIPIRCISCSRNIADKYQCYLELVRQEKIEKGMDRKPAERPTHDDALNAMSYRKSVGFDIKADFTVTQDYVKQQQELKAKQEQK
jgi:hypothetical protein